MFWNHPENRYADTQCIQSSGARSADGTKIVCRPLMCPARGDADKWVDTIPELHTFGDRIIPRQPVQLFEGR
jgi:hypothetical protein